MDDIDPFEDIDTEVDEAGLSRLSQLFQRRSVLADEVERLEAELKVAKRDLTHIDEKEFPDLFEQVGIDSFKVGNREISVQEKLYGSLPSKPEERAAAMAELERAGGSGILKAEVSVTYSKGEMEIAEKVAQQLRDQGVPVVLKESAHPSTYQAWAREQLANGVDINLETLGLYNRRFIKVK